MVDLKSCSRVTNIVLGIATMILGVITAVYLVIYVTFKVTFLGLYILPFFLMLAGFLVLTNERDIQWVKQNCQFLNHRVGVVFYYAYLACLMGELYSVYGAFGYFPQILAISGSIGYMILAVLFALVGCFGYEKVNAKAESIQDKITAD